jgi:hypothetical protein
MAKYLYANNARSSLLGNVAPTDPAITLPNGDGALFPMPASGKTFLLTIEDVTGNIEIVECTARTADTLTVTRGREGTLARAFSASTLVEMRITAGMLGNIDWTAFAGAANGVATLDGDAKLPIAQFDTPLQVYGDGRWNLKLGFTPVQQGGGAGQLTNKVYIGFGGTLGQVLVQVDDDAANYGPIAFQSWVQNSAVAKSAQKLQTARAITTIGVVTGSAGFDGSAECKITTSMADGALTIAKTSGLQAALDARPLNNASNAASITFTGTITGGSVIDSSDMRIKENVDSMALADAVSIVMQSRPVRYHNLQTDRADFGFVADEQEDVTPELIFEGPGDKKLKGMAYQRMTSPITRVLQALVEDARARGVQI